MARKDVFANINAAAGASPDRKGAIGYVNRGASKSMISSLNELAEKAAIADLSLAGETIVELDTNDLDASFVSDRLEDDETSYQELLAAIQEQGQMSPILVRPHPQKPGRFQIVYGHRRARVAKDLGRPVRAFIKTVDDTSHVIAQGQENSARENLSFIERALFAQQLINGGYERTVVRAAITVDLPMLTRMLSITSRVPEEILRVIGAAKSIGRDRWTEFAQKIESPDCLLLVRKLAAETSLTDMTSDQRFEFFYVALRNAAKPKRRPKSSSEWSAADSRVRAEFKGSGSSFSIALKAADAVKFGRFIAANFDRLHDEFTKLSKTEEEQ